MDIEELKKIADSMGYRLQKKPSYDCSCWIEYPNIFHRRKNGKWKCVDLYECVSEEQPCKEKKTYCRMKIKEQEGRR